MQGQLNNIKVRYSLCNVSTGHVSYVMFFTFNSKMNKFLKCLVSVDAYIENT